MKLILWSMFCFVLIIFKCSNSIFYIFLMFSFISHVLDEYCILIFSQLDPPTSSYNTTYINHSSPHSSQTTNSSHTYSQVQNVSLLHFCSGKMKKKLVGKQFDNFFSKSFNREFYLDYVDMSSKLNLFKMLIILYILYLLCQIV